MRVHPAASLRICRALAIAACWAGPLALAEDADEDSPPPPQGLWAQYSSDDGQTTFQRVDDEPALSLAADESPDPRLPAGGWSVRWRGRLNVQRPGKHRFAVESSGGRATVSIAGQQGVQSNATRQARTLGPEVELSFGLQPIEIEFHPASGPAELAVRWRGDGFDWEPLPPHLLALPEDMGQPPSDPFLAGRLASMEHNCQACHRHSDAASATTPPPIGPKLTLVGERLRVAWMFHWLGNPQSLRPEARMPRLFTDDRRGEVERYAVAIFLATRSAQPSDAAELAAAQASEVSTVLADPHQVESGRVLYERIGCAVCHDARPDQPSLATLRGLGQKLTPQNLAEYLLDPAATNPAGRMPGLGLSRAETNALAWYLVDRDRKESLALSLPTPPSLAELRDLGLAKRTLTAAEAVNEAATPPLERLARLGREIVRAKRCAACHELAAPDDAELASFEPAKTPWDQLAARDGGCWGPAHASPGEGFPIFAESLDRSALRAYAATNLPAVKTPAADAQRTIARLACLRCHERNGHGGLARSVLAQLLGKQTAENAELISPPPLTRVADKLTGDYLRAVLLDGRRARPWMALRMPQFSRELVAALPGGLAALDGIHPTARPSAIPNDPELAEAGRVLVGSRGFGCFKCHDMLGITGAGTRGPELAETTGRINFAWFDRWLADPQRIAPGTRMPTAFYGGQTPYREILNGDPARQRQAIWHYLAVARDLPPPDGLQQAAVAHDIASSTNRPQILRTFLPEMTPRSLAIRYASGVHLAYDAQQCRIGYAWRGEFLDLGPVWTGRGGNPAGIKGEVFWRAPPGFPWDVTASSNAVPDFDGRASDTTLGAALPDDGNLHPSRLHFRGYSTRGHAPTFRYELDLPDGGQASFAETVDTLATAGAVGVLRETSVVAPGGSLVWLLAAVAEEPPHWQSSDGASGRLGESGQTAPAGAVLKLRQNGRTVVLHQRTARAAARWLCQRQSGGWAVVLRAVAADGSGPLRIPLATWVVDHDDETRISALVDEELKTIPNE